METNNLFEYRGLRVSVYPDTKQLGKWLVLINRVKLNATFDSRHSAILAAQKAVDKLIKEMNNTKIEEN